MRTSTLLAGPVLGLAATTLVGLGATSAAATESSSESTTTRERGTVIECGGSYRGQDVFVSVYENDAHMNVLQVVVGDDGLGSSRQSAKGFVDGRNVRAALKLDGDKVRVTGSATPYGKRVAVHEEHDDAGQHIVVDGYHRQLRTDLTMTWRKQSVDLDCDDAFRFDLTVTTTDTTGDSAS
ncbi:hypothetical protein [Nocardioides sp. SYSU DS0663]|uniref:hypothetical protein n=1 Tax=Nocardioides sp. SYSU DS0663 TaxID=3416445 RepID=UPI003F4B30DB